MGDVDCGERSGKTEMNYFPRDIPFLVATYPGLDLADKRDALFHLELFVINCFTFVQRRRMSSSRAAASSAAKEENPELARFRAEWLAELQSRRAAAGLAQKAASSSHVAGSSTEASQSSTEQGTFTHAAGKLVSPASPPLETAPKLPLGADHPALNDGKIVHAQASTKLQKALNIYRRAVELEQQSELDEALLLYRQAFRMVCSSSLSNDLIPAETRL